MYTFTLYRDPASYVHNPDVIALPNGDLLMTFRQAPRRRQCTHIDPESRALVVRSNDQGHTWDTPVTAAAGTGHVGIQDPSLCRLRDGRLLCSFFAWDAPPDAPYGAQVTGCFLTTSEDEGLTWSPGHTCICRPSRPGGCVATTDAILELPDGTLVAPVYDDEGKRTEGGGWRSIAWRSTDGGASWLPGGVIGYDPYGELDFCEPALALLPDGKLLAMLREDTKRACLWQSESTDGGLSWSRPRRTPIWGFPADLTVLAGGGLLCLYGYRRPPYGVRACISRDHGASWDIARERIVRADGIGPDIGYPSSVQLADGSIFTAYYVTLPAADAPAARGSHDPAAHFADGGLRILAGCLYHEW